MFNDRAKTERTIAHTTARIPIPNQFSFDQRSAHGERFLQATQIESQDDGVLQANAGVLGVIDHPPAGIAFSSDVGGLAQPTQSPRRQAQGSQTNWLHRLFQSGPKALGFAGRRQKGRLTLAQLVRFVNDLRMATLVLSYSRPDRCITTVVADLVKGALPEVEKTIYWDNDFIAGEEWFVQFKLC
jgi:hypothetical protein